VSEEFLRGTGRTQFMIDEVIGAILDGQPLCRVVGHTHLYARDLKYRLMRDLGNRGIDCKDTHEMKLYALNTEVTFHSKHDIDDFMRGMERYDCQFWDHYALECIGL
jgi:hypothetical protein